MKEVTYFICGSVAYDTILVFQDHFKYHILPDQIHALNVSFTVPELKRNFGGCGGNVAYNLSLLGQSPYLVATVGQDHSPYTLRLNEQGIKTELICCLPDTMTAQAFITTDLDDNQITAFHPGAMARAHENRADFQRIAFQRAIGIVSPDGREGMLSNATQLFETKIPFIFDPGQALTLLNKEDIIVMLNQASYGILNAYEANLLVNKLGLSLEEIAQKLTCLIVTNGSQGCVIYEKTAQHSVPAMDLKGNPVVDPTGCGDAFRAGFLFGLGQDWSILNSVSLGCVMGAIKISSHGGQTHCPSKDLIADCLKQAYGINWVDGF